MVFCNTLGSCRAVDFAFAEASVPHLAYHGDIPLDERKVGRNLSELEVKSEAGIKSACLPCAESPGHMTFIMLACAQMHPGTDIKGTDTAEACPGSPFWSIHPLPLGSPATQHPQVHHQRIFCINPGYRREP